MESIVGSVKNWDKITVHNPFTRLPMTPVYTYNGGMDNSVNGQMIVCRQDKLCHL